MLILIDSIGTPKSITPTIFCPISPSHIVTPPCTHHCKLYRVTLGTSRGLSHPCISHFNPQVQKLSSKILAGTVPIQPLYPLPVTNHGLIDIEVGHPLPPDLKIDIGRSCGCLLPLRRSTSVHHKIPCCSRSLCPLPINTHQDAETRKMTPHSKSCSQN